MRPHAFKHEYHDALLKRIQFDGDRVTLEFDLCSHCNHELSPHTTHLIFESVKNVGEVRQVLNRYEAAMTLDARADVAGIEKTDKTRYHVYLSHPGSIEIDCRGLLEI